MKSRNITPDISPSVAIGVPTQFLKCLLVNENILSACAVAHTVCLQTVRFVFDNRLADASSPENLSVQGDFC